MPSHAVTSSSAVYARLLQLTQAISGIDIIAVHHSDVPTAPSTSSSTQLLPSLLSPTFSSSLLHLTLHSPALLAHLHHSYSIHSVGQDADREVDGRLYEYLPLLHNRHWGSPLHVGSADGNAAQELDASAFGNGAVEDSADPRDLLLNGMSEQSSAHGATGRCCVQHTMRGLGKSNRRSEAAKMVKGLEGMQLQMSGQQGEPASLVVSRNVSQVLRIRNRSIVAGRTSENIVSRY